ncbi:hypothetical protein BK120_32450 [Paenibacillus sp. FSL A5-0031]|uniref:hypothetical protein n=1 Tax=Paenibacillus sp. FSL A5-0031 TaxID=1920420 RepID=UPI00096D6B85|nr:hypothetical protein [Paenibacillus sp. FSL A5-0031]OME73990.1 hypothetical protein BK120_32450 [Paenibacillus sp. FSL A5-0031]
MKERFSNFFDRIINYYNWFLQKGRFTATRIADILYILIVIMIILYVIIGKNQYMMKLFGSVFGMLIFFMLFLISFKSYWIRPPKFIRKNSDDVSAFLNTFSHSSYLYGLTIFTFFLTIMLSGLLLMFSSLFVGITINWSILFLNILFLSMSLFTMLYFMFHISRNNISLKLAKARISFYLFCSGCITAGLFGTSFREALTPFLSYVGIGYLGLRYLIDKIDSENEIVKSK